MSIFFLLASFVISFGFLLVAMTVHEFAHGYAAYRLGDNTARFSGRLSLNPFAHIDPIGTFLLPLVLFLASQGQIIFGAAKPVPINYWALRNPKRDVIWIGLSGPLANFILAVIVSILWRVLPHIELVNFVCSNLILINLVLGIFNLIPVPPLDGSRIVMGLLPPAVAERYAAIEPFGFFIVMVLWGIGLLNIIVWPLVVFTLRLLIPF